MSHVAWAISRVEYENLGMNSGVKKPHTIAWFVFQPTVVLNYKCCLGTCPHPGKIWQEYSKHLFTIRTGFILNRNNKQTLTNSSRNSCLCALLFCSTKPLFCSVHKTAANYKKRQMLSGLEAFSATIVSLCCSQQAGSEWTQILSDKAADLIT